MKKLISSLILLAVLILGSASYSWAASAENSNTGKKSQNEALAFDGDFAVVWNDNHANLNNFTFAAANTGFNYIGSGCQVYHHRHWSNTEPEIETGNAEATANTTNFQNTNLTAIEGEGGAAAWASNSDTGRKSNNSAWAIAADVVFVGNFNHARINNFTVAMANTGFNSIKGRKGSIKSGNAEAAANTTNTQNTNYTMVSGDDNYEILANGGVEAKNSQTGKGSENIAIALGINANVVVNKNQAKLNNHTVAGANTGFNTISGGTKSGSIETGDASATANTTNTQNTNVTAISDDGEVSATAQNEQTGKDSTNETIAVNVNANVVVNENQAKLDNHTVAGANTGMNSEQGSGKIETGDASATANTTNTQNTNMTSIGGLNCLPSFPCGN